MKQILAISGILLLTLGIPSCYNDDWSFPDFDYTTTYFPYQYPVRILVLGDYNFDNSNDNALKFLISANMGGVYKNNENISVQIAVDESLTDSLYASGVKLEPLPNSLYTLSSSTNLTIPSGKFYGSVEVQLAQAFLDDPLAASLNYVIPLKIINSTTDSVLLGLPNVANPDPRVPGDWITRPQNFTLFGITFVNEYHGRYLIRGTDIVKDAGGATFETNVYRNKYVERSEVTPVNSIGKNTVFFTNPVRLSTGSPGKFSMDITFDASGNGTISDAPSAFPVTGSAKFVKDADEWGGEKRNTIYLDYVVDDGTYMHNVKDTLVFRDKNVSFTEYNPEIHQAP